MNRFTDYYIVWAESDDAIEPDEPINGESIRIPLGPAYIVKIVRREGGDERVIEAWVYDEDAP